MPEPWATGLEHTSSTPSKLGEAQAPDDVPMMASVPPPRGDPPADTRTVPPAPRFGQAGRRPPSRCAARQRLGDHAHRVRACGCAPPACAPCGAAGRRSGQPGSQHVGMPQASITNSRRLQLTFRAWVRSAPGIDQAADAVWPAMAVPPRRWRAAGSPVLARSGRSAPFWSGGRRGRPPVRGLRCGATAPGGAEPVVDADHHHSRTPGTTSPGGHDPVQTGPVAHAGRHGREAQRRRCPRATLATPLPCPPPPRRHRQLAAFQRWAESSRWRPATPASATRPPRTRPQGWPAPPATGRCSAAVTTTTASGAAGWTPDHRAGDRAIGVSAHTHHNLLVVVPTQPPVLACGSVSPPTARPRSRRTERVLPDRRRLLGSPWRVRW